LLRSLLGLRSCTWIGSRAVRRSLIGCTFRADDATIVGAVAEADRAAMDCPFGWPEPFVEFVNEHRSGHVSVPTGEAGLVWRRRLSRRETDLAC
jgi:hypothetical protein